MAIETGHQDSTRKQRLSEIAAKLAKGQAVTLEVREDHLSAYLDAALVTGFKFERIAGEGEEYPFTSGVYEGRLRNDRLSRFLRRRGLIKGYAKKLPKKVMNITIMGKGTCAVLLEKPVGERDFVPFFNNLKIKNG